ncbi:MAG: SDR family oxidoreductase [Thiothrix sp.]|uniref:UDP-glucose 4-epimerase family protein n=1 Tax=Thiothrix sp. TaxID=1032 RepID=UPI002618375A|nr:SDR family oxidoreductase [Thiothrix sp.]MDD5394695.1 SDR family oxidoreductase [Thiothrix sp.]
MAAALITGASGFVASHLCPKLADKGYTFRPISRTTFGNITPNTDWSSVISGVDCVIHLAARVHLMQDSATDPLAAYRATNTSSTLNLARQAATASVRRFIFLSSIKVNGEGRDTPYTEQDPPAPTDPYAISKWEAEQGLLEIAAKTGMEVVILRPPLIYGAGVKANFLRLMQWVEKGIPLPFGAVANQRSLLYIGNLVDAIRVCIEHPAATNQTFLVCDNEALSTAELIRKMATHFQRKPRLLNIPPAILLPLLTAIGRKQEAERLLGSLLLDNHKICQTLGWQLPFSVDAGLAQTVMAYRQASYA